MKNKKNRRSYPSMINVINNAESADQAWVNEGLRNAKFEIDRTVFIHSKKSRKKLKQLKSQVKSRA